MTHQLDNIDNIYDLLALCSSYIFNNRDEKSCPFKAFKEEEFDFVYDAIEDYCMERERNGRKAAFQGLKQDILKLMACGPTVEKCFAVVKFIDELVEVEQKGRLLSGNHIVEYQELNHQYTDQVRLLPKRFTSLHNRGDRQFHFINKDNPYSLLRKRRDCPCSELDRETANYMIWDEAMIKCYPAVHIYRLDEGHPAMKRFCERGKIVFGIVPLMSRPSKDVLDLRFVGKMFYIDSMHPDAEGELRERYGTVCDKIVEEDIDFLVFPELMMTEGVLLSARKERKAMDSRFIINGSIWKDYVNKCVVTDGNGKEIFSYCKKEPFLLERENKQYEEWLDGKKNKDYAVLEMEGIGRISIGICRDLISEEVKKFHKCMGTDILIIPAYSESEDLLASAEELSKEYNCIVVVTNACSAFKKNILESGSKPVSFLTLPAKNGSARSVVLREYNSGACYKKCGEGCSGVKVSIDFLNLKQYGTGMGYEIEESPF